MKKRIFSLLLALVLVAGMMPLTLGAAADDALEPTEEVMPLAEGGDAETTPTPEPTEETDPTPTPEPTEEPEPTPTPEATAEAEPTPTPTPEAAETPANESDDTYNNTTDNHTDTEPTPTPTPTPAPANDYSGDVGKYLVVASQEYSVWVNIGDSFAATDAVVYTGSELAGLIFRVTDWYVDADDSDALWYCVTLAQGEWPEGLTDGCWLLQDYLDEDYRSGDSFTFVDAPEEPDEPDEPTCICGEGDEFAATGHASDCPLYLAAVAEYVTGKTVEQLCGEWPSLDKVTREMILTLWCENVSEDEYAALTAALPNMVNTVTGRYGETAVTLTGDIPQDATLVLAPVAEADYHADILNYVSAEDILLALDITPQYADGTAWQPYGGETATVTISLPGVADGTRVRLFHNHEGTLRDLTTVAVENGKITFEMERFSEVYASEVNTVAQNAVGGVVYFDLSAGDVTINATTYTGYRFDGGDKALAVTGSTADATGGFYVYQSNTGNQSQVGLKGDETSGYTMNLPQYTQVENWADYITDNTDVASVITEWDTRAAAAGRSATEHQIAISGNVNHITVTVDNVWSSYHDWVRVYESHEQHIFSNNGRKSGGLQFKPGSSSGGHVTIHFKGDNRFGNIYYTGNSGSAGSTWKYDRSLTLTGDVDATVTVCNLRTVFSNKEINWGDNFWCSAIGSDDGDSTQNLDGLKITGGCIYAGTLKEDDCTAIGGGGNGHASITISGGTVTAVSTSSGTAIGGGIGKGSGGGAANITIDGTAKVYAYNFSCHNHQLYYTKLTNDNFILAAAIGSGSSGNAVADNSVVTIEGNSYVYARSVGGPAIGGGSTLTQKGGSVTVNIGGSAVVDAASIAGNIEEFRTTKVAATVPAGVSIGGGNGGHNGDGGDCVLTISGTPTIYTGSIGGGKTLDPVKNKIGSATVKIEGGTTQGQVIMATGSGKPCSFTMTGGTIDNTASLGATATGSNTYVTFSRTVSEGESAPKEKAESGNTEYNVNAYTFLSLDGGAVFVQDGTASILGGTLQNVRAKNGGAVAVEGASGTFSMTGGTITAAQSTSFGGAIYISQGTATLSNGTVESSTAPYGGAIAATGGTVTLAGATITDCTATKKLNDSATEQYPGGYGGAVAMNGGTFNMTGGQITMTGTDNKKSAEVGGGAVYISGGTATLSGGSITGAAGTTEAPKGGAVFAKGGELTLSGVTISSTSASDMGGAVYVEKDGEKTGSVTMSSGTIENVWAKQGGAIAATGGSFTMSGGKIEGCTAGSSATATDGDGGAVYVSGGEVKISGGQILGDADKAEAANGGGVYISNGTFTMTAGEMKNFSVTGNETDKTKGNGGVVYITGSNSAATISGGTISGNPAADKDEATRGGAVYVGSGGTFCIEGTGHVQNCNATESGGGVYMESGSFTIETNGKLEKCTAGGNGGGVYLGGGTFTATGGSLTSCSAGGNGGGLYMVGGTFTMPGATIEGCTAKNGGGVYLGGGTMNITGGTIQGCEAKADSNDSASGNGGGAYVADTDVQFGESGKTITVTGNRAVDGAGLYISNTSGKAVTITDGVIENNIASGNGGGLYQTGAGASCTVSGSGQIKSNQAQNGGGFYIAGGSALTVNGGHITENQATGTPTGITTAYNSAQNVGVGGGVYIAPGTSAQSSSFKLDVGTTHAAGIYSNTAAFAADDLYASPENTTLSLPDVSSMALGDGMTATGWYGDYHEKDTGNDRLIAVPTESLQRYQVVSQESDVSAYEVDVGKINSGDYVCLTIGKNNINFGTLTIENKDGADDQHYVFKVTSTALDEPLAGTTIEFEVTIKGSGSVTVIKVPYGSYTVTAVEPWSWRYTTSTDGGSVTVGKDSNPTVTFTSAIDTDVAYDDSRNVSLWLDANSEGVTNVFGAAKSAVAALFARKGGEG